MAANWVPETPPEIIDWPKGTIYVRELLKMPFKENYERSLIEEYSPETSESETGRDFAHLLPVTIE